MLASYPGRISLLPRGLGTRLSLCVCTTLQREHVKYCIMHVCAIRESTNSLIILNWKEYCIILLLKWGHFGYWYAYCVPSVCKWNSCILTYWWHYPFLCALAHIPSRTHCHPFVVVTAPLPLGLPQCLLQLHLSMRLLQLLKPGHLNLIMQQYRYCSIL